jgi:hypothetical protein
VCFINSDGICFCRIIQKYFFLVANTVMFLLLIGIVSTADISQMDVFPFDVTGDVTDDDILFVLVLTFLLRLFGAIL